MKIVNFHKKMIRQCNVFILCLLLLGSGQVPTAHAQEELGEKIYDNGIWWIEKRDDSSVPAIQSEMTIYVDGVDQGTTRQLSFGHKKEGQESWPEVAVIYNTGYIRLVPFDLPWGTSFILGPAYWEKQEEMPRYFHNIQISRIDISTSEATNGTGTIHLTVYARDYLEGYWPSYHMDMIYNIMIPDPDLTATKMHVRETYTVANSFSLSDANQLRNQDFKWVQFSSMYIDEETHDSDGARYQTQNGNLIRTDFKYIHCDQRIFLAHQTLSANYSWVEVRHSDNLGWRGNTPNAIIIVNNPSMAETIVPQGYITCTKDSNGDNVGVWLNHRSAPRTFSPGNTNSIEYTLIAQDDPFAPPQTLLVNQIGNGSGTVSSDPAGITCGSDCSEQYAYDTFVTLTASPSTGSTFAGWGGACSGTDTCTVRLNTLRSVRARFIIPAPPINWYIAGVGNFLFGEESDIPAPADYNGDGKADLAVFRPSNGIWYISSIGDFHFGETGDLPVVNDYDGDGRDDIAVFRPSNSTWYISSVGNFVFGEAGDIPVPGDYNGDNRADIAVFRPSDGTWYISSVGNFVFGEAGDVPVPGDYNGDGSDDIAIYRPSNGTWYISTRGNFVFGEAGDIPVPGDYNHDGLADIAVFRP